MRLILFQVYKLSQENTQSENFSFKETGRGGIVNRTSVYAKAAVGRVLLKKCVMRNFAEFTRKYLRQNLFFDKVINSVDLHLY